MPASTTRSIVPPPPYCEAWFGATGFPAARFSPCATARLSGTPPWPALVRISPADLPHMLLPVAAEYDAFPLALAPLSECPATAFRARHARVDIRKAHGRGAESSPWPPGATALYRSHPAPQDPKSHLE